MQTIEQFLAKMINNGFTVFREGQYYRMHRWSRTYSYVQKFEIFNGWLQFRGWHVAEVTNFTASGKFVDREAVRHINDFSNELQP